VKEVRCFQVRDHRTLHTANARTPASMLTNGVHTAADQTLAKTQSWCKLTQNYNTNINPAAYWAYVCVPPNFSAILGLVGRSGSCVGCERLYSDTHRCNLYLEWPTAHSLIRVPACIPLSSAENHPWPRPSSSSETMRQLAAAALAFAYAGGAMAFAPAPSALPTARSANSMRSTGVSLAPQARPTVSLRKGRSALQMADTMEGRHLPKIIQGGMGVQVLLFSQAGDVQLRGTVILLVLRVAFNISDAITSTPSSHAPFIRENACSTRTWVLHFR